MTISSIKFICSESLSTYETKCKYYRNAYKFRQYFLKLEMLMVQNCGKFKKRKISIDYCYAIPYHICYKESLDYKGVVKYDKYINAKDIN